MNMKQFYDQANNINEYFAITNGDDEQRIKIISDLELLIDE